eukprot:m.380160 g.380160  ORF g.380160 m.380160 type:complete len:63 (-) comp16711_c0_seq30:4-192(-)
MEVEPLTFVFRGAEAWTFVGNLQMRMPTSLAVLLRYTCVLDAFGFAWSRALTPILHSLVKAL